MSSAGYSKTASPKESRSWKLIVSRFGDHEESSGWRVRNDSLPMLSVQCVPGAGVFTPSEAKGILTSADQRPPER